MNGKLHSALMVSFCVVPALALLVLTAAGARLGGGAWLPLILICPLAHLLMIRQTRASGHRRSGGKEVASGRPAGDARHSQTVGSAS